MTKCVICGREFDGFGNNPNPIVDCAAEEGRCCDSCNWRFVVPMRLQILETREFARRAEQTTEGR